MFEYSLYACFIGFILDLIFGDPYWIYHPICLIGKLIEVSEKIARKIFPNSKNGLLAGGGFLAIFVCFISTGVIFVIDYIFYSINNYLGLAFESIICYFMLATKSLKKESMKVYKKLSVDDVEGARYAVSMIVGRDTKVLDKIGIIKATVETVAENLSDGVIAPLFYLFIGGSVLGVFYKAINTMDSMIGYKNDKYIYLGRCAAKLDDFVNFLPSRISAVLLILSSFLLGFNYKNALKIFKRDRLKHASPNSAQTEAVCAGALDIQLAGNAYYFGKLYEKPFIGEPVKKIQPQNIIDVNRLMYMASILAVILFGSLAFLIRFLLGVGVI